MSHACLPSGTSLLHDNEQVLTKGINERNLLEKLFHKADRISYPIDIPFGEVFQEKIRRNLNFKGSLPQNMEAFALKNAFELLPGKIVMDAVFWLRISPIVFAGSMKVMVRGKNPVIEQAQNPLQQTKRIQAVIDVMETRHRNDCYAAFFEEVVTILCAFVRIDEVLQHFGHKDGAEEVAAERRMEDISSDEGGIRGSLLHGTELLHGC